LEHPYRGKELVLRTGRIKAEELVPHRTTELVLTGNRAVRTGLPFTLLA
jgi:hypothetical protein